jgi:hypothetical protein
MEGSKHHIVLSNSDTYIYIDTSYIYIYHYSIYLVGHCILYEKTQNGRMIFSAWFSHQP